MKADIQGVKVEGTVDEIATLINKLNNKDTKFFKAKKAEKEPFKQDDPYGEHRNIIYTNKNSDPFDQIIVRFENTCNTEKLFNEISKTIKGRGVKLY